MFGSSSAIRTLLRHRAPPPAARTGSVNENVAPRPGSLSTHSSPPNCSHDLAADRQPEPGALRLLGKRVAHLTELLEDDALVARRRSRDRCRPRRTRTSRASGQDTTDTAARRPRRTSLRWTAGSSAPACSRSRSARTAGTRVGTRVSSATSSRGKELAGRSAGVRDHRPQVDGSPRHSARPDSIFARSSTWLIRRVSRSLSWMMMPTNRCRSPRSSSGLSCRISEKARIDVSGVRSSWRHRRHEVVLHAVELAQPLVRGTELGRRGLELARLPLELVAVGERLRRLVEHAITSSIPSASSFDDRCDHDRAREAAPMAPASAVSDELHQRRVRRQRRALGEAARRRELREQRGGARSAPRNRAEQRREIGDRRLAAPGAPSARPAGRKTSTKRDGLRLLARPLRREQRHDDVARRMLTSMLQNMRA